MARRIIQERKYIAWDGRLDKIGECTAGRVSEAERLTLMQRRAWSGLACHFVARTLQKRENASASSALPVGKNCDNMREKHVPYLMGQ